MKLGYSDTSIRYGDKGHRDRFQHHELPKFPFYMSVIHFYFDFLNKSIIFLTLEIIYK